MAILIGMHVCVCGECIDRKKLIFAFDGIKNRRKNATKIETVKAMRGKWKEVTEKAVEKVYAKIYQFVLTQIYADVFKSTQSNQLQMADAVCTVKRN